MALANGLPELPPTYNPSETEPAVSAVWSRHSVFHADGSKAEGPTYSIVIPPPNVTAALHLGHALNNTLQDVLIRFHRMRGKSTLWMPGTDHAGIATQTVVEKRLLSQGTSRLEIGREKFVEITQDWKDEYEQIIINQLLAMGASCDFDRTRFTMDDICATAVRHAFFELFRDGLIYRGKRLVNWDPVTRTALADDEVEMEEIQSYMWYLRYPLEDDSGSVVVATTRPETMLGDTAVAINPNDPRAETLVGKTIRLPIVDRVIPIISDDYVIMEDEESDDPKAKYASGFLKVTPAHDPNDWDIGLRHSLPVINVLGPDGSISDENGWDDVSETAKKFVGLSREEAREAIIYWFKEHDLLADERPYTHSVGHSYRSHAPIEPWLSDQWYVAVTDDRLRGSALRAQGPNQVPDLPEGVRERSGSSGDGELTFYPERYARTYYAWHDGIRDWCISRQLWWGHQIPVWIRVRPIAESPIPMAHSVIDEASTVESEWVTYGAAHMVRKINEREIEESVCIPPDSTLRRLNKMKIGEQELTRLLEEDGFIRDPDVLDTWFSSALWPLSTMGWPWPEDFPETIGLLEKFNPTSVLSTAREIITLWVSRMVMFNRYFLEGQLPFRDVFIHAMVQDGHGQKMSKSLGNGVDPRDIIFTHGADAMRFALVQMTTDTQDVRMPVDMICPHSGEAFTPHFINSPYGAIVAAPEQESPSDPSKKMVSAYGVAAGIVSPSEEMPLARNSSAKFDLGRNFANKLWNATRFALRRVDHSVEINALIDIRSRPFADQWIIARLSQTISKLEQAIDSYQFNVYADTLYDFVWHDVCDRYLEIIKPTVNEDKEQQAILAAVLDSVLRIMHPVCPFITEALWPHVSQARCGEISGMKLENSDVLASANWPALDPDLNSIEILNLFERSASLIGLIRSIRAEQNVKPKQTITLYAPDHIQELLSTTGGIVEILSGVGEVLPISTSQDDVVSPLTFEGSEILVAGLLDTVDLQAQQTRLMKLIEEKTKQISGFETRLSNPGYLNNAKPELIEETRTLLETARADLKAAQNSLDKLK
ncbi:MAG: valine--tRNA ligase [Acidimicrobiaceae bacterium]|nr:valine--tRNA ligase [Acidimicrobiaceae bacterium]|tara:strand:+ start:1168 stop:4329 length:3162 start_codon:yes stop_codon:yes gene_type:complete